MERAEIFQRRLERLQKRAQRWTLLWDSKISDTEKEFQAVTQQLDEARRQKISELQQEEERLKGELDQAAQSFTKTKYLLEKEAQRDQNDINRVEEDLEQVEKKVASEMRRLNEENVATRVSYDKQKSALSDLYQEKRRSLMVAKDKLTTGAIKSAEALSNFRQKTQVELEQVKTDYAARIGVLKDQLESKRHGWDMALETIQRERSVVEQRKKEIEGKIAAIRADKEKELESTRAELIVAREQLELDKVTLIEKAEQDQKELEASVHDLNQQIEKNERDLQDMVANKHKELQLTEEGFLKEESMLKEAVKSESDKRDYEQKLFMQEKTQKESELKRLQDDYDERRSHWDNQIRTLTIQKSVQDAEHEAERLRTDREARTGVRSLQAKKEEMQQRLSDIKTRYDSLEVHAKKEQDLLQQRWTWRKDRLWSMWQGRLDVLKKERQAIHEQLEQLEVITAKKREALRTDEGREEKRIDDLQQYTLQVHDRSRADEKQREIQFELEKTRIVAQIKECEASISDWIDRQKSLQKEVTAKAQNFSTEMGFLDRLYREEQSEGELFMHAFQKTLSALGAILDKNGASKREAA